MQNRTTVAFFLLLCVTAGLALGLTTDGTSGVVEAQQKKGKATQTRNPCARAQTQLDLNNCFCEQYQKADKELNRVYQQLLATNKDDTTVTEKLKAAQRAWIAFRDAELEAAYPTVENPRVTYGSVYPMCYCLAQQALTEDRTRQLQRMLSSKEGNVCG